MSDIKVEPGQWVEIFDEFTSGVFRIYSMRAKIKRSATLPTDGGIIVDADREDPSDIMYHKHNGSLKLYIYNMGRSTGYVERDI